MENEIEKTLQQANDLKSQGKCTEAAKLLEDELETSNSAMIALLCNEIGQIWLESGDVKQAQEFFQRGVQARVEVDKTQIDRGGGEKKDNEDGQLENKEKDDEADIDDEDDDWETSWDDNMHTLRPVLACAPPSQPSKASSAPVNTDKGRKVKGRGGTQYTRSRTDTRREDEGEDPEDQPARLVVGGGAGVLGAGTAGPSRGGGSTRSGGSLSYSHVVEVVSGIGPEDTGVQLEVHLRAATGDTRAVVRRLSNDTPIAVFSNPNFARKAIEVQSEGTWVLQAFNPSSDVAAIITDADVAPPIARQKTTAVVARRLIGSALGDSELLKSSRSSSKGKGSLNAERSKKVKEKEIARAQCDAAWDD